MSEVVDIGAIRARMSLDISDYQAGVDRAKAKLSDLGKSSKATEGNFRALNGALGDVGASSAQIGKINEMLRKANPELLKKQLQAVRDELTKLGASASQIDQVTQEMEKSAKGASRAEVEVKALGLAYTALTAAMTAAIAKAVETSATFEQSMANLKSISQASDEELGQMRNQAMELGAATRYSASQAADAAALLAQAGFRTKDILAAMPGVLSLAAAGQMGLADTADIAANALNGFQLEATETGRIVDVLAKSAIDTNADVTDLGMALSYVAPVAKQMGISVEEAVAAIGELSNAGIKGERAGTGLRAMLLQLASPSKEAAGYMEKLGISISDSTGNILPLSNVIGQMQGAFARLTQAQQTEVAATLVGQEAATGFLTLVSQGKDVMDDYTVSLQNAGGTAQQVADTQMDTLSGSIDNMKSALEGVGITVGDTFAPAVRGVVDAITKLLTRFQGMSPELRSAIVAFGTVTPLIAGATVAIVALRMAFANLQVALAAAGVEMAAFSASIPIIGAVSLAIGAVAAGLSYLATKQREAAEAAKQHDEAEKSLNETLNKAPIDNTIADVEAMREKVQELQGVLEKRTAIQERINQLNDEGSQAVGPGMISELDLMKGLLAGVDEQLKKIGYNNIDDAKSKFAELNKAIEASIPALVEAQRAEVAQLAVKVQHIDKMKDLAAQYDSLSAKETLSAQQKQQLASVVEALTREYPGLNAQLDEENRWHITNRGSLTDLIEAENQSVKASAERARKSIEIWKAETEAKVKLAQAQIDALERVEKFSFSKSAVGKRLPGELAEGLGMIGGMVVEGYKRNLQAYSNKNQLLANDLDKQLADITAGAYSKFSATTSGSGVDLSTPKKAKTPKTPKAAKPKTGKSAEELAAEARKKAFDIELSTIRYQADMFDQTADQQIKAYEKLKANHKQYLKENIEDERTLNLQLKHLQEDSVESKFNISKEWISREEFQMQKSGKTEQEIAKMKLDAWTRVRDRYKADSEQYREADRQVYEARKVLTEKTISLAEDLVKNERKAIDKAKKADLDAIEERKKAALAGYDARMKAIDDLLAKESEINTDADYETQLAEKRARVDLLASAVGPDGIKEREDLLKEIERMQLEHDRDLRKRDLESQKDAIKDEKDATEKAFEDEKSATEAQYEALAEAFDAYSGDIKSIEQAIAAFRVSANAGANAQILSELDSFVSQYNAKMATVAKLQSADDLSEYNANKDAWEAAKKAGNTAEMARLAARNEALRKQYGITQDTGKLQSFKYGGIIQGQTGAAVTVQAHAGEIVLNPLQQAALWDTLNGGRISTPSGTAPTPAPNVTHIDMSIGSVEAADPETAEALYNERERVATRLRTQGVKTR